MHAQRRLAERRFPDLKWRTGQLEAPASYPQLTDVVEDESLEAAVQPRANIDEPGPMH
jgi:hypothetical protein